MDCNRNRNINRNGQVMGEFGIPRIELRGPGCINGTGRCDVAGARGRCTDVFGRGNDFVNEVRGTGERRCFCDDEVQGSGGRRDCFDDEVQGTGGRRRNCDNVMGTGGRNRNKNWNCCDLETPTIVPR